MNDLAGYTQTEIEGMDDVRLERVRKQARQAGAWTLESFVNDEQEYRAGLKVEALLREMGAGHAA